MTPAPAQPEPAIEHAVFCTGICRSVGSCRSNILHEIATVDGTIVPTSAMRWAGEPIVLVSSWPFRLTAAIDLQFAIEKAIQSVRFDINITTGQTPPNSWWRG